MLGHVVDDMLIDGRRLLAGEHAAVDVDHHMVGHGVHADAAGDGADAQRRPGTQVVLGKRGGDFVRVSFQDGQHAGHLVDGVVAQVRLRAVGRAAARAALPAHHAAMSDHDLQQRRLGDHRQIRAAQEECRSAGPKLRSASAPTCPNSSPTVQASTTVGRPGGRSSASRTTAPSIAVSPP